MTIAQKRDKRQRDIGVDERAPMRIDIKVFERVRWWKIEGHSAVCSHHSHDVSHFIFLELRNSGKSQQTRTAATVSEEPHTIKRGHLQLRISICLAKEGGGWGWKYYGKKYMYNTYTGVGLGLGLGAA